MQPESALARFCPGAEGAEPLTERIDRETEAFIAGSSRFARAGRRAVGGALVLTFLEWVLYFSVASALLVALGLPPLLESLLFQVILQMVAIIPLYRIGRSCRVRCRNAL